VVGVVAGFDDHAVADPGDQDVRDGNRPAAGRSLVAVLGDDDLGIRGPVRVQPDGAEALDALGPARRLGEMTAKVGAGAEHGAAGRERVADIGALGVQGGQLVELLLTLSLVQVAGD
jgi:hypothetical protein